MPWYRLIHSYSLEKFKMLVISSKKLCWLFTSNNRNVMGIKMVKGIKILIN